MIYKFVYDSSMKQNFHFYGKTKFILKCNFECYAVVFNKSDISTCDTIQQ